MFVGGYFNIQKLQVEILPFDVKCVNIKSGFFETHPIHAATLGFDTPNRGSGGSVRVDVPVAAS
mgnify:CR=1 FL=1